MYKEVPDVDLSNCLDSDLKMGLVKPVYKIIEPDQTGNFEIQWASCLNQLERIALHSELRPVRVNIFVKSLNHADYHTQHEIIEQSILKTFENHCPPFGVVMQEPDDPFLVIIEAGFINKHSASIIYGSFNNRPYCIVDAKNYKEYWTVGAQSVHPDLNILKSSTAAFSYLHDLYQHLGLSFDNIVRQWNYVGEILSKETIDQRERQHYQMFNETRSIFYKEYRLRTDFPAATGIGMLYLGVCIDSFAVTGDESLKIIPVNSPIQSESFKYGQQVLVGAPDCKLSQNQPPQFERAKLIVLNNASRLLISGTASIIGQDTVGIGDVEEQTRITVKNIEALASAENIKSKYPAIKSIPDTYSYIRVYVKYKTDIPKVKAICSQFYGNTPATYVVADICRDNLLVEIEAELIS